MSAIASLEEIIELLKQFIGAVTQFFTITTPTNGIITEFIEDLTIVTGLIASYWSFSFPLTLMILCSVTFVAVDIIRDLL